MTRRPGYLMNAAPPPGTNRTGRSGRLLHAVACFVNSGDPRYRHGVNGFHCNLCAQQGVTTVTAKTGRRT